MSDFKWCQFAGEIILWAVRWYCRYGISYRHLKQRMGERGVLDGEEWIKAHRKCVSLHDLAILPPHKKRFAKRLIEFAVLRKLLPHLGYI